MNIPGRMNGELGRVANLPESAAQCLPGRFYSSPEYFAYEVETFLSKEWHYLGRTDEVPQPGDYFTTELLGEPLLIVHGDDHRVRVLSNVCRHRGMPLAEGSGSTRRFVCPYHAWSYDRDGVLANAPRMRDKGVTSATCRLPEFRSEIWQGFIYVNLDDRTEPLGPHLQQLGKLLENYRPEDMRIVHVAEEEWRTNWKCLVENFMEAYHLSVVHPETLHPYTPTGLSRKSMSDDAFTSYCAKYPESIPPRGTGAPGLTAEERQRSTLFCLFPTQVASQAASLLVSFALQPLAVDRIRVRCTISAYGDDLTRDEIDQRIALWAEVNREAGTHAASARFSPCAFRTGGADGLRRNDLGLLPLSCPEGHGSPRGLNAIAAGDSFSIQAGCDKSWETCRARFSNGDNFGGFLHMPGQEVVIGYANQDDLNDGGSLFR